MSALFVTPWTVAHQAPPFMGFPRQEYGSGLPWPSPGDLPDPGIKPGSPALQADALTSEPPGKSRKVLPPNLHTHSLLSSLQLKCPLLREAFLSFFFESISQVPVPPLFYITIISFLAHITIFILFVICLLIYCLLPPLLYLKLHHTRTSMSK